MSKEKALLWVKKNRTAELLSPQIFGEKFRRPIFTKQVEFGG
jgi:hypothetical protein